MEIAMKGWFAARSRLFQMAGRLTIRAQSLGLLDLLEEVRLLVLSGGEAIGLRLVDECLNLLSLLGSIGLEEVLLGALLLLGFAPQLPPNLGTASPTVIKVESVG